MFYVEGLGERLRTMVKTSYLEPMTLVDWQARASQFDKVYQQQAYALDATGQLVQQIATPAMKQLMNSGGNEPFDIGKLSLEEQTRRKTLGLCLQCGKPGHFAKYCRNKPFNPPPRSGGQQQAIPGPL